MEEKEDSYSLSGIVVLIKKFISYLLRKIVYILIITILGGSLGLLFYLNQKPKYIGVSSFVLQEKSANVGSFSGLASQFGFDMTGATSGASLFSGENILDILKSKRIISQTLLTSIKNGGKEITLIDYYLNFTGLRKSWKNKEDLKDLSFPVGTDTILTPLQDSIMQLICGGLSKAQIKAERLNKKTSIIEVSVISPNKFFSKYMSERLITQATEFYVITKTSLIRRNVAKLETRSDSILRLLNYKTYSSAQTRIFDPNPAYKKTLMVPMELEGRDRSVLFGLYGEVTKNLELSRVTLAQETPLIQILDTPGLTLNDNKKGKFICIVAFAIAFFFLAIGFYFIKYILVLKPSQVK